MKIRFVVIDDAAFLREIIKNIMTSQGAIFAGEADDGVSGIELVDHVLPDLVFLDMVMPEKNGLETAKDIKQLHPQIKIIGCSTVDQEALIEKAHKLGFDAYLTKPFSKEQLVTSVQKLFAQLEETPHGRG